MKIIFAVHPEKGHVNPMIGTAQALVDLGHSVSVVATGDIEAQIQAAGLSFHRDLVGAAEAPPSGRELVEFIEKRENMVQFLEIGFIQMAEKQVSAYAEFFAQAKPDLLIIDPMNYAAILAAEVRNIPWVGVSSSLTSVLPDNLRSEILALVDLLRPRRAELFAKFGIKARFRAVDCLSPNLNISFSSEAFVGQPVDNVELVGPALPVRARGDRAEHLRDSPTDRPVVYASFGSQLYHQPKLFRKIIEAGRLAGVFLILSIGDLIDLPEWETEPENCQFYQYAPQLNVLRKANLFITHGGANSVAESLHANVPMLISPMCNDQEHQAYFVERAGVGRTIDLRTQSASELAIAIGEVLFDVSIQNKLKEVGASYQTNGSLRAAQLIHEYGYRVLTRLNLLGSGAAINFAPQPDLRSIFLM